MAQTEAQKAYQRAYYKKNRDAILANGRARRLANLAAVQARTRKSVAKHYEANRSTILTTKKEKYANDPAMRERMKANAAKRRAKLKAEAVAAAGAA